MLGNNNFSDYEDCYPRIAPSPIATFQQNAIVQPNASVPEVSLIFAQNANSTAPTIPTSNAVCHFSNSTNHNAVQYQFNSTGPAPPKSLVPDLSMILANNNEQTSNAYSNVGIQRSQLNSTNDVRMKNCSLPIKTFSMFKKEFVQKVGANPVPLKHFSSDNIYLFEKHGQTINTSTESEANNAIDVNREVRNESLNTPKSQSEPVVNKSESTKNNIDTINSSSNTDHSIHCNCSNKEIVEKMNSLSCLLNEVSTEVNKMRNEFNSLKLEMKSELKQTLEEVIAKHLKLPQSPSDTAVSPTQKTENNAREIECTNYGKEIQTETHENYKNGNPAGENANFFDKQENRNVLADNRSQKKVNSNQRLYKKPFINIALDPLPENSPLVISSDRSLVMQRLAEKYLPETYYNNVVATREVQNNENKENQSNKHVNELSFASYDYMKRYNLISDNNNMNTEEAQNTNQGHIMFFENYEKAPKFL